jgi:hypothetical protein
MLATYAQADSYSDRGLVRLRYKQAGQWVQDEAKLAVRLVRPNKLSLRAYQLRMTCDGNRLCATITDQDTADLDGQMLLRPAPDRLQLDRLYDDPVVLNVVASGLGGPPATLELLLADEPLKDVLQEGNRRELLTTAEVSGQACWRIQVTLDVGTVILWVECQSFLLRRLEYPTARLFEQLAQAAPCSDLSLTAEFRDAAINEPVREEDFAVEIPTQAKTVRSFVLPPQPAPTEVLGRVADQFHFTDLHGRRVTRESLSGHICVLAWFNDHASSQACLRQLNDVRRRFPDSPQVAIYGVCTEPTARSNDSVQRLGDSWGVAFPIVRDLEAYGRDVFRVPWAPTVVVLDRRGAVQAFEVGADPALAERLQGQLKRLLKGEDLAAETLTRVQQERRQYEAAVAAATVQVQREARAERTTR